MEKNFFAGGIGKRKVLVIKRQEDTIVLFGLLLKLVMFVLDFILIADHIMPALLPVTITIDIGY